MRLDLAVLLVPALVLAGCLDTPCGTVKLRAAETDPALDADDDGWLDLHENCGHEDGSFGSVTTQERIVSIKFQTSAWGPSTTDYLHVCEVYFLESHLQVGAKFGLEAAGGYGMHKPTGVFTDPTQQWPITELALEVLDGPSPGDFDDQVRWKLRWRIVVGGPSTPPDRPFYGEQFYEGEDWIQLGQDTWPWKADQHGGSPPDWHP